MTYPKTADEIAEDLRGTCQTLPQVLEKHGMEVAEDDIPFLEQVDSLVFCCEQCSWWWEISEQADDGERCEDCASEEDED